MPRRSSARRFVIPIGLALFAAACGAGNPAIVDGAARVVDGSSPGAATTTTTTIPGSDGTPGSDGAETTTTTRPLVVGRGVAVISPGGADLANGPTEEPFMRIAEGISLGVTSRSGDWLEVVTTCNERFWLRDDEVDLTPQASRQPAQPGPGFDLSRAVIVLDPGHGDRDWGAVGPSNLGEKAVNLDIAERAAALFRAGADVDWATGEVTEGDGYPAVQAVFLTRSRSGPNDGDYELGLAFRAELANAAGADVMVSIHNNSVPQRRVDVPGTEVYYAIAQPGSDRLAGILYEELLRSFSAFEADWRGGEVLGARARIDSQTGEDYYGLLRRAAMPAVIAEGLYLTNPSEEALLASEEVRQAWAEAVYRGIVRFLTTDDPGSSINPPEIFVDDAGTVDLSGCGIPPQR